MFLWFKDFLDLLFPRRCPICHEIVKEEGRLICWECKKEVEYLSEPVCKKCGKPVMSEEIEYCFDCQNHKQYYTRGIGAFKYCGKVRESIFYFKYKGRKEYSDFYTAEMKTLLDKKIDDWKPDVIMPVPLHRLKLEKRGFNQAELLARRLGKQLNLPVDKVMISRRENTKAQKELGNKERRRNLNGAFDVKDNENRYKRVLLVDDIYTTGSTVNAISKLLKEKGIQEIYFIVVCIGKGY
jgi:ComF family protein